MDRTKDGKFKKGVSGNPKGKPKGARHAVTVAAQNLLESESEALSRKAVEMALEGDTVALRLCLERILPAAKERPIIGYSMVSLNGPQDVLVALGRVAEDLSEGRLIPSEATAICNVLGHYRKHYEATELEERLRKLEAANEER